MTFRFEHKCYLCKDPEASLSDDNSLCLCPTGEIFDSEGMCHDPNLVSSEKPEI